MSSSANHIQYEYNIEKHPETDKREECCGHVAIMAACSAVTVIIVVLIIINIHHSKTSVLVNPFNFEYILQPNQSCTENSFDILIWIHSDPHQLRNRITLRETWANSLHMEEHGQIQAKLIFFVGASENDTLLQTHLEYESEFYQDLVQASYIDSYHNLTYKAMSALKWINSNCNPENYSLVLKGDDDLLVDNDRLSQILRDHAGLRGSIPKHTVICDQYTKGKVVRGNSKWSISKAEYARRVYPPYCAGMAVILTNDLIAPMWIEAEKTKFFWIDDVFLTGLLLEGMKISWKNIADAYATLHYEHPRDEINWAWVNRTFIHHNPMLHDQYYHLWWSRFGKPSL